MIYEALFVKFLNLKGFNAFGNPVNKHYNTKKFILCVYSFNLMLTTIF